MRSTTPASGHSFAVEISFQAAARVCGVAGLLLAACQGNLGQAGREPIALPAPPPMQPPAPAPVAPPPAPPSPPDAAPSDPAPPPPPAPPPADAAPAPPPPPAPAPPPPAPTPPLPPAPPPAPAQPPRPKLALLVVGGDIDDPGRGDEKLATLLGALGFAVVLTDEDDDVDDAPDAGLVVISASAGAAAVAGEYRNFPAPVLVMSSALFDDMRMTGAGNNLGTSNAREVEIRRADHPLAAQLSGRVAISAANSALNWGVPAPAAVVVATLPDDAARATVFGYEAGAAMQGQNAPARRVGFFAGNALTDRLSAEGTRLFEAAATWAWSR